MSFPGSEIKGKPLITVVSVTNTPTAETAHALRSRTKAFTVICNEFEMLRVAWDTGAVGSASGDWFLLYPRESYAEEKLLLIGSQFLYMNAPDASAAVDVAVIEWQ